MRALRFSPKAQDQNYGKIWAPQSAGIVFQDPSASHAGHDSGGTRWFRVYFRFEGSLLLWGRKESRVGFRTRVAETTGPM